MKTSIPNHWGIISLKYFGTLEQLAKIISDNIFAGCEFGGLEKGIYEEVPAVFIDSRILGMNIILSEGMNNHYNLEVHGNYKPKGVTHQRVQLDEYLYFLLRDTFIDNNDIEIVKPKALEDLDEPL
jgi:hypothetical protein